MTQRASTLRLWARLGASFLDYQDIVPADWRSVVQALLDGAFQADVAVARRVSRKTIATMVDHVETLLTAYEEAEVRTTMSQKLRNELRELFRARATLTPAELVDLVCAVKSREETRIHRAIKALELAGEIKRSPDGATYSAAALSDAESCGRHPKRLALMQRFASVFTEPLHRRAVDRLIRDCVDDGLLVADGSLIRAADVGGAP